MRIFFVNILFISFLQNVFLESMDHTVQINEVSFVVIKNVIEIPDIVYTDVKEVTTEVTVNIVSYYIVNSYSIDYFYLLFDDFQMKTI